MPTRSSVRKVRRFYEFIKANRHEYSVQMMCRLLEVTRSGYYAWLKEPVSDRAHENARLLRLIRASYVASHGIYGAPRIFLDLREAGETCSKHRVARLMRVNNIRAVRGYGARRHSATRSSAVLPNSLQRNFTVAKPNTAWVTDITYSTPSQRTPPGLGRKLLEHAWNAMLDGLATAGIALLSLRKGVSRSGGDLLTLAR